MRFLLDECMPRSSGEVLRILKFNFIAVNKAGLSGKHAKNKSGKMLGNCFINKEEEAKFSVSQKIRKLREKLGMTQQALAKKVKTTQSAIARIESTDYEGHSLSKLEEIAKALGAALIIDFIPKEKIKKSA